MHHIFNFKYYVIYSDLSFKYYMCVQCIHQMHCIVHSVYHGMQITISETFPKRQNVIMRLFIDYEGFGQRIQCSTTGDER